MTVLNREQVEEFKNSFNDGINLFQNLLDTIEHLQAESDRRELAHEKARHDVEVERDRLKAHKPYCFIESNGDACYYKANVTGTPKEACKECHWREVEAE